ncbi:MAG: hypothetical protein PHP69_00050 [Candidatus Omnitrophica bacterium]|jgi:HKD family nuclease|nr:hypothetical protein [Candidatus Omnitrophota bacterium]MDD5081506.1 hypothetical protein [Candidatus Omnitrophota bacterium]MDD5441126.1 hypothetical protein [Candidatus Omnitrophota bacterium]
MPTYNLKKVLSAIGDAAKEYYLTRDIKLNKITYDPKNQRYLITLDNGQLRIVDLDVVNVYIESGGLDGSRKICTALIHSVELEQSVFSDSHETEELWEGDIGDVRDYLNNKDD